MHSHLGKRERGTEKKAKKKCFTNALSSKAVHLLCTAPCLAQLLVYNNSSVLLILRAQKSVWFNFKIVSTVFLIACVLECCLG